MKKFCFVSIVLAIMLACSTLSLHAQDTKPKFRVLTPASGAVLRGGKEVIIKWDAQIDSAITTNPFGEMELYLETVEGGYFRITPQLSPTASTFNWTVPSIESNGARLALKAGVEGEGDQVYLRQTGTFTIRTGSRGPAILLNAIRDRVKPGSDVELTWLSTNMEPGINFDVMISYDRGAHFHKAGSTPGNGFVLPIEEDFAGSITVQILGRRSNGTAIRSLLTPDATIRVGDDSDREK